MQGQVSSLMANFGGLLCEIAAKCNLGGYNTRALLQNTKTRRRARRRSQLINLSVTPNRSLLLQSQLISCKSTTSHNIAFLSVLQHTNLDDDLQNDSAKSAQTGTRELAPMPGCGSAECMSICRYRLQLQSNNSYILFCL